MADVVHPDSDWAGLGSRFLDRGKAFQRLEPVTVAAAAAAALALQRPDRTVKHGKRERILKGRPLLQKPALKTGRPKKHPDLMAAANLRRSGLTWAQVAARLHVHRNTLLARRREVETAIKERLK